ncbi:MAG: exodeoxyribonuclease VII small subunit [Lachnospiraceae bacterium]|nr:exodeoxyribonuclease VII small subunit [Lachnospiraceae bacterium]
MAAKQEKLSIEEAFEKIDLTIEQLEDEDISLEDAFQEFQKGMELVRYCDEAIDKIEKKVQKLTEEGETEDFV